MVQTDPVLVAKNVTKIFGHKSAEALKRLQKGEDKETIRLQTGATIGVQHANFEVSRGELFVIMGLSGSGKSTLLRCLNRLIEPTVGEIWIDGTEIRQLRKKELFVFRQKHLGMVFQQFALLPHRTVEENVGFGLELQGMDKATRRQVALAQLQVVGLAQWADEFPHRLSGGMQQRVGLARALAMNPTILLMDEAFSALDPLIRDEMQNELLRIQRKLKKTILFITHDLNEALKLGDRIALMKEGQIVQIGTPEEIISQPANDYVAQFVRSVDLTKVLTAADVMTRPTPQVRKQDGLRVALRKMREGQVSSAYVLDEHGRLMGLVRADEVAKALENGAPALESLLHPDIQLVSTLAPFEDFVQVVVDSSYPVAVVDEEGEWRGLLSKSSVLEALSLPKPAVETTLTTPSAPTNPSIQSDSLMHGHSSDPKEVLLTKQSS